MKRFLSKFLVLLGVCLFLGAGNANAWTWCLVGNQFGGWGQNENYKFLQTNNTQKEYSLAKLEGEFKIYRYEDGNNYFGLDEFNGNCGVTVPGTDNIELKNVNNNICVTDKNGKIVPLYDVTLYIQYKDNGYNCCGLYITGSLIPNLYFRTSQGGSDFPANDYWKLQTSDNVTYTRSGVNLKKGDQFKIANTGWNDEYTFSLDKDDKNIEINTKYKLVNNKNGLGNMVIAEDADNATIKFTRSGSTYELEISAEQPSIYVVGYGDEITWTLPGKEVKRENGKYTFKVKNLEEFRFSKNKATGWDNNGNFNGASFAPTQAFGDGVISGQTLNLGTSVSKENIKMPWTGNYTITISGDFKTITAETTTPKPTYWVLKGQFETGNAGYQEYTFVQSDSDPNLWHVAFVPKRRQGNIQVNKDLNGSADGSFALSGNTLSETNHRLNMVKSANNTVYSTYNLDPKKLYLFTWNTSNNRLSVEESQTMYLYGHLNRGSWDRGNYVELTRESDGVYKATSVEVAGRWNQKDVRMDPTRKLFETTGDENYVALYSVINTKLGFDRTNSRVFKYGTDANKNNFRPNDNPKNNLQVTTKDPYDIVFQTEEEKNNFVLKAGFYNITVDVNNNTITFDGPYKEENQVRTYVWCFGDDDNEDNASATKLSQKKTDYIKGVPHYTHTFKQGDSELDVVQVSVSNNPKHPAARQVTYTVWYKGTDANKVSGKRMEAGIEITKPEGFDDVEDYKITYDRYNDGNLVDKDGNPVSDAGVYTVIGSEDFGNNHLLKLNAQGQYFIAAQIKDGELGDLDNYTINPATLLATVAAADVTVNIGSGDNTSSSQYDDSDLDIEQPFSVLGANTFEGLFSFETSDKDPQTLTLGTDFTISITPQGDGSTWVALKDYNDQGKADEAYQVALNVAGATLYDQYTKLAPTAERPVDGFFTTWDPTPNGKSYKVSSSDNGATWNVTLNASCSGVYTMVLESNGTYKFDTRTVDIVIYPNLTGEFGTNSDYGFNVNGYTFMDVSDATPTINVPSALVDSFNSWNLIKEVPAFIPGTYFPDEFTITSSGNGSSSNNPDSPESIPSLSKRALETTAPASASNYRANVDLSNLVESKSQPISVYIKKNGAAHTYSFLVQRDDSTNPSTTEVGTIEVPESGEAVYYNLQGVKVENPEHGIYVKVQGGKATKVVL